MSVRIKLRIENVPVVRCLSVNPGIRYVDFCDHIAGHVGHRHFQLTFTDPDGDIMALGTDVELAVFLGLKTSMASNLLCLNVQRKIIKEIITVKEEHDVIELDKGPTPTALKRKRKRTMEDIPDHQMPIREAPVTSKAITKTRSEGDAVKAGKLPGFEKDGLNIHGVPTEQGKKQSKISHKILEPDKAVKVADK